MKLICSTVAILCILAIVLVQGQSPGCPLAPKNIVQDFFCPARLLPTPEVRPIDGALENECVHTGKSFEAYDRVGRAHYDDCKSSLRKAKSRNNLPTVRQVVNGVFRDFRRELTTSYRAPNFLAAMMGQYIAHDIGSQTNTPGTITPQCCAGGQLVPPASRHPACLAIPIEASDPDYSRFPSVNCLNMIRSAVVDASAAPVSTLNTVTAYVDNSNLYGNEETVSESLKAGVGGRIISNPENILPIGPGGKWFLGDNRLLQTPQLAIIHSLYYREHNRIAGILEGINPHWTDKRLFEETRRIVIAQFQHVVYEEFLHTFISPSILALLDVPDLTAGFGAVTFAELNSATFRMMHGLIPSNLTFIDSDGVTTTWKFHRMLFDNAGIIREHYDEICRGLLMQPVHSGGYDPALFQGLFASSESAPGTDILSIDLNRGRDHGLPPYANILRLIKGSPIRNFADLSPFISNRHIALLRNTYEAVEDVDLLAGALLETPKDGTLMGPTSQLMFLKQFSRLKTADPYFYTNRLPFVNPKPFTTAQLREIKKASTNLLFCLNSGVTTVPRKPSFAPTSNSEVVNCSSLPQISYESWREASG